jgi:hypothetical protein
MELVGQLGGSLPSARNGEVAAAGTTNCSIVFWWADQPTQWCTDETEEYDGTSWTAGGNLNTARGRMLGFGIQTSAIAAMVVQQADLI